MNIFEFVANTPPELLALAIILGAFISEDATTLAAASLAATGTVDLPQAFVSSVAGIWLSDLALYAMARRYGRAAIESEWAAKVVSREAVARGERWFGRFGSISLFISRCIPGTRLPLSLAAGTLRMSPARFALIGGAGALVWVAANFAIVSYSHKQFVSSEGPSRLTILVVGTLLITLLLGRKSFSGRAMFTKLRRWSRWEFWPAWLFYIPVAFMYVFLAIKYRGASLPALANPGQINGGLVGESKAEILAQLYSVAPEHTAEAFLIEQNDADARVERLMTLIAERRIELPFVLKPNVGQRGAGFKKITGLNDATAYLRETSMPMLVQRYAPGPREAGVFYYRLPKQKNGAILAITRKTFPTVQGDGTRTLRELIADDPRASLISDVYLKRFKNEADRVIEQGVVIRLVEAGNHCQGCIFSDATQLSSPALTAAFDDISFRLPGFYIGRYDIRYESDEELVAGRGFTIVELNGAASEATSIYDAQNSLMSGYRTLYRQWELVFAIGRANRDLGLRGPTLFGIGRDWFNYAKQAACYPLAD